MSADEVVNVGDGRTFSMKQMIAIVAAVGSISGLGGAATMAKADADQNQAIVLHDHRITQIETVVKEMRTTQQETRDAVLLMEPNIDGIESDVKEIQQDLKTILQHLNDEG